MMTHPAANAREGGQRVPIEDANAAVHENLPHSPANFKAAIEDHEQGGAA
jgi:hypothetical protein